MAEILSQNQIDALLSAAFSGSVSLAEPEAQLEKKFRKYDFYSPRKFTKDRLKMLNGIFESYSRILNSRINGLLHTNCEVKVEAVEEQRYYEFSNALTDGAVVSLAQLDLKGKIEETPVLIYVTSPVMISMMDRMMGGEGELDEEILKDYTYTDLDLHLYESLMKDFVSVMGNAWENYTQLNFQYGRTEVNPTLVQLIGLDEAVVLVDIKLKFSNCEGNLSVCLPGMTLTNIFAEISRENPGRRASSEDHSESIFDHLRGSNLEVVAELARTNVQLNDIYNLNVGDVIDLNQSKDAMVYLHIGGRRWFGGLMGMQSKNVAIKIDTVYHQAEGRGNLPDEQ